MGEPIIIWPPDGYPEYEVCQEEFGAGFVDCSGLYYYELEPGEVACCPL